MKNALKKPQLTTTEAIVLQQLHEDGEEDIASLSQQLHIPHGRISSLINTMKQKGLLIIQHDYQGTWVRLSRQGHRLVGYMWPEAQFAA